MYLYNKYLKSFLTFLTLFLSLSVFSQAAIVKGTVVDETGMPLLGATIVVEGTTNGVTTDFDGNFLINVKKDNAILVFSYLGFETYKVTLGDQTVVNVIMKEDLNSLEEVQVVAFSKQKKSSVIGSVSTINTSDLKLPSTNLTSSFAGQIAGMISYQRSGEPGQDNAEFFIHGLVGQSMTEFRENLPEYRAKLDTEFSWIIEKLAQYNINVNQELIATHLDPATAMSVATNFISGMGGVLSNLFLILLTVIFMLFEADSIPKRLHIALSDPDMKLKHIDRFIRSVNSYLAIKTVVSLGTGLIIGTWLYVMGIDHFLLWAVLAFMLNFIPNIGSIIAALPAVLIAFVQYGLASAGMAALGFLLVNTIMGNMVEPRLMGKGMGLSTLVVFLSLIFWGWLLGTVGMLLSVPLTMVVKIALESREESQWLAVLLSSAGDKKEKA